ncbi:MAG TPA: formate dehydrogenase accessory sulfurtransferase FdhD [Chitinophagales bacterium]|nr:formate dehydrogenase accessory sulfurtransferase FdhD [Chitinophagales bacterium]HRK27319.1 formate dehydrogenase accessory sulfurtransferase FdhD [Chitinophagales bacterium]
MSTQTYTAHKYANGAFTPVADTLATEEMLSISINHKPFTITMRTTGNETELIRGLLFAEQIYTDTQMNPHIAVLARSEQGHITEVNVTAPENLLLKNYADKRSIISVSSCGICGKTELDTGLSGKIIVAQKPLNPDSVAAMFNQMSQHQQAFKLSGGVHAAAIFDAEAQLLIVKEDIGRHNAVDKAIGSLLLTQNLHQAQCLLVSGRISYEIVSKTYHAGIPFLAAVSAPSSMAVDFCRQTGITLLAFCRNNYFTVYANSQNLGSEK